MNPNGRVNSRIFFRKIDRAAAAFDRGADRDDARYTGVDSAMKQVLPDVMKRGIKVIANAGGINPRGCAAALQALASTMGLLGSPKKPMIIPWLLNRNGQSITLANVAPHDGEVVISLHYQAGMRASPGRVQIEPAKSGDDPIGFVRLRLAVPAARVITSRRAARRWPA